MTNRTCLLVALASLGCICAAAQVAGQPSDSLTANRVIELARARAPEVRVADAQVLAARARLLGARAISRENPVIERVSGSDRPFERNTQLEVQVPIGLGIRRAFGIGVAKAEFARDERLAADVRRRVVGVALASFYRVLHAEQRLGVARERSALAEELSGVAAERFRAGEAARLEVNVAEVELFRSRSLVRTQEGAVASVRAELAAVLGLHSGSSLGVQGDLGDRSLFERVPEPAPLELRPDLRAAESELAASASAIRLARTALLPGLALRWDYVHEAGLAFERRGLAVSVPLFNQGHGERAEARARREQARVRLEGLRAIAAAELEGARVAYQAAVAAVAELEQFALQRAQETEAMARESYRAGKLDLPGLLFLRRDALDTRLEYLDRLLTAALGGVDLMVAAGTVL